MIVENSSSNTVAQYEETTVIICPANNQYTRNAFIAPKRC